MVNINKEQAKHLDIILQLLVDGTVNVGSVNEINENLLRDKPREYCLSLFYILANYHPRLLYPIENLSEDIFWATDYVPAFLHDGGFSQLHETAATKQKAEDERQKLSDEKLVAEVDIVKFQKGLGKRLTQWGFVVGILSIVASVFTTIWTNRKDTQQNFYFDTVFLKKQLQNIEKRLEVQEHKKLLDTLHKKFTGLHEGGTF